jgi:hypothetical protein
VTGTEDERERRQEIASVLFKLGGVVVAIGLVIGVGAWLMVKALDLDESEATGGVGSGPVQPVTPLPTTALPVPSESASPDDTGLVSRTSSPKGDLYLNASPVIVGEMERINLTGRWLGHDNEGLLVQRFEDGSWVDFGVQANVNVGTFETYVMTGRPGDNRFRVFDPRTETASNEVTITVE